ncbi:hypothetical protein BaRGS_00023659 [Batillaria attramentaria]|uniref:Dol-P-Glc:Glc(2)Man(9)GlcNAc(2)-PP-Dol alpha-1,2-glucosyltransferase n=1 Tax=Batillaria attramentaria TaxID=370345 RepID=A0ABD0KD94_9CAEN
MLLTLVSAILVFLVTTTVFFVATNNAQRQPYMDEVFHVPQAQQYCAGNFTAWDPMITTLPGLYLASLPLLYPVAAVFSRGDFRALCTTSMLRSVNILFSLGNLYVLYIIAHRLHYNRKNATEMALTALALATFPVLYFFTCLYYTDPAAIFFALVSYSLTLSNKHVPAAVVGAVAILFRQTNVMWVLFCAGIAKGAVLKKWLQLEKKDPAEKVYSDWTMLSRTFALIGQSLRYNPRQFWNLLMEMFLKVWSYVLVGVGFVAFVIINKGIVVGDRSNHQPCVNFPQLFYFLFVTVFFSFMHMISVRQVLSFLKYAVRNPVKTGIFHVVGVVFVYKFMYIHEYNLADNRHYNFYFLSKLVRRNEYMKYLLIPTYYYAFVTFWSKLQHRDVFWKLAYIICTAATLVPQRMLEFRYFIMPYLLFRLNMPMPSKRALVAEVLFYFLINSLTVYMYVYKPFPWPNANSLQRFMW